MRTSSKLIYLCALFSLSCLISCGESQKDNANKVSNSIEGLELSVLTETLDSTSVKLDSLPGSKPLVFWATWCGVCVEEKPTLARLKKDLNPQEFSLIEVNMDKNPTKALSKYKEKRELVNLQYLPSPSLFNSVGKVELLPTIILLSLIHI